MTLFEWQRKLESDLRSVSASSRSEARLLLEAVLSLSYGELVLRRASVVSKKDSQQLQRFLERRLQGEPLQYILGTAPFYGLELRVTPDVLIPRPETERLVEFALDRLKGVAAPRVLDVGTGSGALALALKTERPDAHVFASDISEKALDVARKNADLLGLDIPFFQADVLDASELKTLLPDLDLLLANPPYLPQKDEPGLAPEVRLEPHVALFAGQDGLSVFRRLEAQAYEGLSEGAHVLVELDPRNVRAAARLASRWRAKDVLSDLNERERFLALLR